MRKEIFFIVKNKRFLWMAVILLFFVIQEGIYKWVGGPVGIFGECEPFYDIIKCVNVIFPVVAYTKQRAYEVFLAWYGGCLDATAQFARDFVDALGSSFYMLSFLIGAFLVPGKDMAKNQNIRTIHPKTLCKRYCAAVFITMILLAILTLLPFFVSFRMKNINMSGSPECFWYYLFIWILPTVLVLYAMQALVGVLSESWIVTSAVHFFLLLFMDVPAVNNYPFYKFIIRFDGRSEAFYLGMRSQIVANRIFISVLSILLLGLAVWIARKKRAAREK